MKNNLKIEINNLQVNNKFKFNQKVVEIQNKLNIEIQQLKLDKVLMMIILLDNQELL